MGLQFRRSKSFGPVRINFSKSGVGTSIGFGGLRAGIDSKGKSYGSANIPGTGITYRSSLKNLRSNINKSMENYQQFLNTPASGNLLGFQYNVNKYTESNEKGCLKVFLWIGSICLIPFIIGIFSTIGLIIYTYVQSQTPKKKFIKYFREGFMQASSGNFPVALNQLNIAERFLPNNLDLIDLKGVCLYRLGYYGNAKQYFQKALRTGINRERYKILYIETLQQIDNAEDYPQIIEAYENYLTQNPDEENLFLLGYYNYKSGNYEKGLSYLQKIPKENNLYLKSLIGMATCFYFKDQIDLAIDTLHRAPLKTKNLNGDLMEIHYCLGNLYEEKQNFELAKRMYQRVYLHDVNYKDVKERIESLEM